MSWLRIDDQAPVNGKLGELSDGEFRALIALWAYCSRRKNGGRFFSSELKHAVYTSQKGPRRVTYRHLERFCELSLVLPEDDAFQVNDWGSYQPRDPTAAERMERYRQRHNDA